MCRRNITLRFVKISNMFSTVLKEMGYVVNCREIGKHIIKSLCLLDFQSECIRNLRSHGNKMFKATAIK